MLKIQVTYFYTNIEFKNHLKALIYNTHIYIYFYSKISKKKKLKKSSNK